MLTGEFNHSIDSKGRLIIPSKLRESLGEHFVITKGMDGCLFLYPDNEWKAFEATEGELDKQGRVLISSSLRAYADLEKEVVLAGVLDKVEIWSKEAWEARTADVEENIEDIASDMEDLGLSI